MNISIAMATYNGEKYLQEQLDSLALQTVKPFELVVCDDGSTDNTLEVIRSFANSAPFPVRIYVNDVNLGYSDNFFKAASLCRGDWIGYCDQDDVWLAHKLERINEVILEEGDDDLLLVVHSADRTMHDLELVGRRFPDFNGSNIIGKNQHYGFWVLPGFACVFRRRLISEYDWSKRPRDFNSGGKQAHDVWICMMTNALGNTYIIKESLVHWRRHSTATTGSVSDYEVPTLKSKIENSREFGADLYRYRSMVARESSEAMTVFANEHKGVRDIYDKLINESDFFEKLSSCLALRERLYSNNGFSSQLKSMLKMFIAGAYFGNRFYAFGWKSLLKDIHHVVTMRTSTE